MSNTVIELQLPPASPSSSSTPNLPTSSINLLPFHLDHDGPAPISTFFMPRIVPNQTLVPTLSSDGASAPVASITDSSLPSGIKIAAFRGRRVQAHEVTIPSGYVGLILTAPPIPSSADIDVPTRPNEVVKKVIDREIGDVSEQGSSSGLRRSPRKRNAAVLEDKKGVDLAKLRGVRRKLEEDARPTRTKKRFSLDSDEDETDKDEEGSENELPPLAQTQSAGAASEDQTSQMDLKICSKASSEHAGTDSEIFDVSNGSTPIESTAASLLSQNDLKSPTPRVGVDPLELANEIKPDHFSAPDVPLEASDRSTLLPIDGDNKQSTPDLETYTEATPSLPISTRKLEVTATFNGITVWNPDGPIDLERDEYVRGLGEWIRLRALVHESI